MATSTPTTPTTLLDAVNELLRAIRLASVMSLLNVDMNGEAADARKALDQASREFQQVGWSFNTEVDYVIQPEADTGEVLLPTNCLRVRTIRCDSGDRLVSRGGRLYNPVTHTYAIAEAARVDYVAALPFEELPSSARLYITALGARRFCIPRMPSGSTFQYTEEFLTSALITCEQEDADVLDSTLPQTSPHFAAMRRR